MSAFDANGKDSTNADGPAVASTPLIPDSGATPAPAKPPATRASIGRTQRSISHHLQQTAPPISIPLPRPHFETDMRIARINQGMQLGYIYENSSVEESYKPSTDGTNSEYGEIGDNS